MHSAVWSPGTRTLLLRGLRTIVKSPDLSTLTVERAAPTAEMDEKFWSDQKVGLEST